jgi:hypothetical protein
MACPIRKSTFSWRSHEVLRFTPDNGRKLSPAGNMYVWDYKGISVTYIVLDPQDEVAVLRVDRFPL